MPGPIIAEGDRVVLRTVERDDAALLQRSSTDPRIRYSLGSTPYRSLAEQEDGIERWVEREGSFVTVACVDEEDAPAGNPDDDQTTPIGSFSARHVDGDRAWLAYWLLPEHTGEGYGKDMATTGIDYLFDHFDLHGISAGAYDFNDASRGLLEGMGFTQVARRREGRYIDGDYHDEVQYDVLRREWEAEHGDDAQGDGGDAEA